jgi:glycerate 2-kinase
MIIQNFKELATTLGKKDSLSVLEAGLDAALPELSLKKIVKKHKLVIGKDMFLFSKYDGIFLVGFGKSADSMAKIVCSRTKINGGIIVIPEKTRSVFLNEKLKILHASHPIPDNQSVRAGKQIVKYLKTRKPSDFVIFLISGGGSSLVSLPDGVSLHDKKIVTSLLLKSGANIKEINCVRKHLSQIKGGKLSAHLVCDAVSLVMSDVVGDDLSDIASAPTYYDDTTFKDADKILAKYNLTKITPKNILKRINFGISGKIPETPKFSKIKNYVIATNNDCLDAMTKKANTLGYVVTVMPQIAGNVVFVSKKLANNIPKKKKSCLIFGGETSVKVVGAGKGGRNQELALRILHNLQNRNNVIIATCGTDGIDGNTDACGAIMESSDHQFPDIQKFLKNNNSYYFFKKHRGLIFTGPTHTNLMDVGLLLCR